MDADEHRDRAGVGARRDELAALLPLVNLERFDRRACNKALAAGVDTTAQGSRA